MDAQRESQLPLEDERTIPVVHTGVTAISQEELQKKFHLETCDDLNAFGSLRTIGLGGIGAVFSAHEASLERDVALKMLLPRFRNQSDRIDDVIREAQITARIGHPNVVPVYRLGFSREQGVYFTMRRVIGRDLRTILNGVADNKPGYRKRFTLRRRLQIFIEVCNGINFAHHNGILHCDLKPSNLMVGDYGEVQIMDWGMAQFQPELPRRPVPPESQIHTPEPQTLAGTPAYLAPERILGFEKEPTILSDVYSLGVILYSILAGSTALYPTDLAPEEVMRRVAARRLPPVRRAARKQGFTVPRELEAICNKAMERNPEKRYQSVGELLQDVHSYLDGYPVKAYHPLPGYRLRKLVIRRPLVPCALLAAILTWSGFQLYTHTAQISQENSTFEVVDVAFRRGESSAVALRKLLHRYHSMAFERNKDTGEELARQINVLLTEQNKNFSASFDFLSQLPEYSFYYRAGVRQISQIIQHLYRLYWETEDDLLLEELQSLQNRNPQLFRQALMLTDHQQVIAGLLNHPQGSLTVQLSRSLKGTVVELEQEEDGQFTPRPAIDPQQKKIPLSPGRYRVRYTTPQGVVRCASLQIYAGKNTVLDLNIPPQVPSSFILVPAGNYYFRAKRERLNLNRRSLPGFLIGRGEVTLHEYQEFWRQLSPAQQKAWLPRPSGGNTAVWDQHGQIRKPYRAELPVTGIPVAAAEAYARWLGRRYGLVGRLPTYQEWLKAARGVDHRVYPWGREYRRGAAFLADHPQSSRYPVGVAVGQAGPDRSPYGVCHLSGNVREWVKSSISSGRFQTAAGGSFLSGTELGRIEDVSFIDERARDVGFRCLLELPKNGGQKKRSTSKSNKGSLK